jgi:intein/homing endonuclease
VFDEKHGDKTYPMCQILVYSTNMVNDLINYGVIPNKTDKIIFPELPNELIRHFIRGYFDGDGSICERKHKKGPSDLACSFTCGSLPFLEKLRQILFENDIKSYLVHTEGNKTYLSLAGLHNPDTFLHYIYDNATIYLDRKYYKKENLYKHLGIEQRLLRQSEKTGFINLSEKENGNPETEIRVEGCV